MTSPGPIPEQEVSFEPLSSKTMATWPHPALHGHSGPTQSPGDVFCESSKGTLKEGDSTEPSFLPRRLGW